MKAPLNWMNDFTPIKSLDVKLIADEMTLTGSKVEGLEVTAGDITNVVTGKILQIEKHPDADKLVVCKVTTGTAELVIVTAAKNVFEGAIVPVALNGATLANNVKIKTGKLRGVVSEGMFCSIEEFGYTTEDFPDAAKDGIYILPAETPVGINILEILGLGEPVIDFEITSNRPDCFSVEGLAREAAITMDRPFTPVTPVVKGTAGFSVYDLIRVKNEEPDFCYRYIARAVRNVKIAPSPKWMVTRLRESGVRSINNIVDITNYVMLELGQPMHAFDYNDLHDKSICIRKSADGESMKTLDEIARKLDSSMLVIADGSKPVALAGVMGGENSEIKQDTSTIVFESANFNGINVRLTAKKLGLRTESSSRFEKGLDPENAKRAMDRACELVEMLGCGEVSYDEIDIYPSKKPANLIEFRPDKINYFLGTTIPEDTMIEILKKLECIFIEKDGATYCVTPGFRPDLQAEVDLAEEVARFYGYNKIVPTLLSGKSTTLGGLNKYQKQKEQMKEVLCSGGFYEACTYSFTSPKIFDQLCLPADHPLRNAISIMNPLGEDYSVMRTTMMGSLLEIAATNWNRGVDEIRIFEIAKVYLPSGNPDQELPDEKDTMGIVYYYNKDKHDSAESFFTIKSILQELFRQTGVKKPSFRACHDHPSFHPGRTAAIYDGENEIGLIGYIHPDVADKMAAPVETVIAMVDLEALTLSADSKKTFSPLPKFPAMTRDLALIVDRTVPVASIEELIRKFGGQYLESMKLFDIYTGKQIAADKKSIAYQLVFRSPEGTLTDDIVNKAQERLLDKLKTVLNATLR